MLRTETIFTDSVASISGFKRGSKRAKPPDLTPGKFQERPSGASKMDETSQRPLGGEPTALPQIA